MNCHDGLADADQHNSSGSRDMRYISRNVHTYTMPGRSKTVWIAQIQKTTGSSSMSMETSLPLAPTPSTSSSTSSSFSVAAGAWWKTRSGHRWFILYFYIPDEVSSSGSVTWIAKMDEGVSSSSPDTRTCPVPGIDSIIRTKDMILWYTCNC